jgi:hypothetical protein
VGCLVAKQPLAIDPVHAPPIDNCCVKKVAMRKFTERKWQHEVGGLKVASPQVALGEKWDASLGQPLADDILKLLARDPLNVIL